MSIFDYTIDRSGCPHSYVFNYKTCCRLNSPEYGHTPCHIVKDYDCLWSLHGRIERLEECVKTLMKE